MSMTLTQQLGLQLPRLEPFQDLTMVSCSQCGARPCGLLCRLWLDLQGRKPSIFSASYCKGSLPPVMDARDALEAMMNGSTETLPPCGGLTDPHLHLTCRQCGHHRLMCTKGRT
jgi:hypothetical protein